MVGIPPFCRICLRSAVLWRHIDHILLQSILLRNDCLAVGIVLVPYAGVPLYLLFGGRKLKRWAEKKARLGLDTSRAISIDQTSVIDRLLRSYHLPGAEDGHCLSLCTTAEQRFAALEQLIDGARQSIHISTFISAPTRAVMIIDKLAKKAAKAFPCEF